MVIPCLCLLYEKCIPVGIPADWELQWRRLLPAAETGMSCWARGQQNARPAQGPKQPLGAATRGTNQSPTGALVAFATLGRAIRAPDFPPKKKSQADWLGIYGGELGTRTPDPLRVMHDDFSIFIAINRILKAICYRFATNKWFQIFLVV